MDRLCCAGSIHKRRFFAYIEGGCGFMENPFRLRNSGRIKRIVPHARRSISMTILQPNVRQNLLTSPASMPLLTAPDKRMNVLEMTEAAASDGLWKEVKRAMYLLTEAMSTVCYICNADGRDFEELYEPGSREEIVLSMDFLVCSSAYNLSCSNESEKEINYLFAPNDTKDFSYMAATSIKSIVQSHVFYITLQSYS